MSSLESVFAMQISAIGLPPPVREYRFAAEIAGGIGRGVTDRLARVGLKDWRFDFAWPSLMLAAEVEGGGWSNGRHTRGTGFSKDLLKYSKANYHG